MVIKVNATNIYLHIIDQNSFTSNWMNDYCKTW